ncbi:MAG: glycosyltransferase, partial [Blastocatellia bacterium]
SISLGTDPQLLVSVALSNDQHIQHVVEVTLRLWEDSRDALFGEIARLGHAVSRTQENVRLKDRRIIELEGELLESQDRFAHEIRGANEYAESIRSSLMLALEESETRMGALIEELLIKDKELRGTREELDRIKTSTGWRLLRSYGKVKHGLFVPALTRARALKSGASAELHSGAGSNGAPPGPAAGARPGEASAGHLKSIAPLYHVRRDGEGQWKSFGIDPQLGIPPPYPTGWVKVVVHIDSTDRARDHCRLYLGIDQEHAEDCSYDLGQVNAEHVTYVHIGENVTGLRLDPVEGPGAFSIRTLQLVPATPEESAQAIESRSEDPPLTPPAMPGGFEPPPRLELSDAWFEVNEWNGRREQILRQRLGELESEPLISVVMPVFNAPPKYLDLAIQSVANQVYRNWELCIADDASTNESIKKLLTDWTARDRRVRPVFLPANRGISSASNAGAEIALGEYLLFMDHDDELSPDALAEMALYLAEHAETDVLYADEDKIDPSGRRYDLSFKPDWSPELFLSYNYINHPLLIRKTLFRDVGAFRTEFNFAQDWDLGLRATEVARHIGHIPAVLYHWRALPTSIASNGKSKPEVLKSAGLALEDALRRRAIGAEVFQPDWAIETACGYYAHRFPHNGPSVAILIPTKNNFRIL